MNAFDKITRIGLLALLATACACLSVEPVDFHAAGKDTSVPEAPPPPEGGADGDVDAPLTCRECIEAPNAPGPGCGTEVAACLASTKCTEIYACLFELNCWAIAVRRDFIVCGLPCAIEAGVASVDDPEVKLAISIAECAIANCGTFCHPAETGGE